MTITKKIEINEKEHTLKISQPHGTGTPFTDESNYYHISINNFFLGKIKRKNGFWYPMDKFDKRPKNPEGLERVLLIFEAADFQAMGEMIESAAEAAP